MQRRTRVEVILCTPGALAVLLKCVQFLLTRILHFVERYEVVLWNVKNCREHPFSLFKSFRLYICEKLPNL